MLNECNFIGRAGKDPEFRTMQNGNKVCNLSLAVDDSYTPKGGEKVERTEWVNVVVFNKNMMPFLENYVQKGDLLFIKGKLKTRSWDDKDGNKRYTTEIVIDGFDGKVNKLSWNDAPKQSAVHDDDFEDEIPW